MLLDISILPQTCEELFYFIKEKSLILCGLWRFANAYMINKYREDKIEFDTICCIYPTAPFVTPKKLREAMNLFMERNASCVVPVVKYSFPPQRAFIMSNERIFFQYPDYAKTRSQDLEPIYHDCGQFYILKTEDMMKYRTIVPPNTYPFLMLEEEVQDIDNLSDWELQKLSIRDFILQTKYRAKIPKIFFAAIKGYKTVQFRQGIEPSLIAVAPALPVPVPIPLHRHGSGRGL